MLAVVTIVFIAVRATGDPALVYLPDTATHEDIVAMRQKLGLDRPLATQFLIYLGRAAKGDFGDSFRTRDSALQEVLRRFPATLQLGAISIIICILIAIPIGVYSAVARGTVLDLVARWFAVLGQSMPVFWLGIVLIYIFSVGLGWLPTGGRGGIQHLVLPSVTLGWYVAAGIMRLTRSAMLDVLGSDYTTLARAKGVPEWLVIWKHAFRNALLGVVTFAAILFITMLTGAVIVEMVFAWPGVGRLVIDSLSRRDFPVIQAGVLVLSAMFIVANLLVDILYGYLNPRIKYGR